MKRIVDFGISASSKLGRLSSGHDKLDSVNGTGEYLGIVRLGKKNLLFTKTTRSGGHANDGLVKINEVDFDLYADGDVVVYYNKYKSEGIRDLEKAFNNPAIIKMIDDEYTISGILDKLKVKCERSNVEVPIVSSFIQTIEHIYPEGYDLEEAIRKGPNYERESEVRKRPLELLIVTGLDRELFEDLINVKSNMHISFYQLANKYREQQQELEGKRSTR